MDIVIKTTKLTKSKIQQMEYIGVPKNPNIEVLGQVNLNEKKYVIVKQNGLYYRAEFITKLEKKLNSCQFPAKEGGWEFPQVHHIKCATYNCGYFSYSPERNDEDNLKLYDLLFSFKTKTDIEGQVYY